MEWEKLDGHFEYNFSTIAERSPPEIEKGVFASKQGNGIEKSTLVLGNFLSKKVTKMVLKSTIFVRRFQKYTYHHMFLVHCSIFSHDQYSLDHIPLIVRKYPTMLQERIIIWTFFESANEDGAFKCHFNNLFFIESSQRLKVDFSVDITEKRLFQFPVDLFRRLC